MILVTGGTGTTGSEIVRQLSAAGARVRVLARNPEKASAFEKLGVEIVAGDLDRADTLDAALDGVESALLLAGNTTQQVEAESNFIAAAKRAATRHVVKLSAIGADVKSPVMILRWHGEVEKRLEESGVPFTHLRPSFFMQNMLWSAQTIATQGAFYLPLKDAKVGMVDVRDIAAVAVKTLTERGHEGKKYVITGPEALSFGDVAEKISAATGKKVTYVDVAPEEYKKGALQAGQPEWVVDAVLELYKLLITEGALVTNVVAEVARKQPITFDQFARDHAQAFQGK